MPMYSTPTTADLNRTLSRIADQAKEHANAERVHITSRFAASGAVRSSAFAQTVMIRYDELHAAAVEEAMKLVAAYVERGAGEPSDLTAIARPILEALGADMLASVPDAGVPALGVRIREEWAPKFSERLDDALRDLEIGFVGGQSMVGEPERSQAKALRLLKLIYDRTLHNDHPVLVVELGKDVGLSEVESEAAWRYLRDRRLIETFGVPFSARINSHGVDVIEDAQAHPERPLQAFPLITNNYVAIGTAVNSPVQQGGAASNQAQTTSYTDTDRADLERLVTELRAHFDEMGLESAVARKARAQIATLEAQLSDEPDVTIVRQAGRTLRNITEGVIAGLAVNAIPPSVWPWIHAMMAKLF